MRIQIDKHTNTFALRRLRRGDLSTNIGRWMVYPVGPERGGDDFSICLEITHDFSETPYRDEIKRVLWRCGDADQVISQAEFEERVQDIVDHEGVTRDEAECFVFDNQHIIIEHHASSLGVCIDHFVEMERQWHAINTFVDLGISG